MDQVKKIMAQLYKHGFWISGGLIMIASLAIGILATLDVQENAKKQIGRIKSAYDQVNPVSAVKDHPNKKTADAWDKVNLDLERRVYQLWASNYDKQQSVLTWPEQLEDVFLREIKNPKYRQPELLPTGTEADLLSKTARDVYRNYIAEELPNLALIIKSKWHLDLNNNTMGGGAGGPGMGGPGMGGPPGGMGGPGKGGGYGGAPGGAGGPGPGGPSGGIGGVGGEGGGPGPGGMRGSSGSSQEDANEVVIWSPESQQSLVTKVFRGINRPVTPSTLHILYAQEDLWIVKALLNVIKKTNGDALERHRAPIKEILVLATGQEAGTKMGGINMLFVGATATPGAAGTTGGAATGAPPVNNAPVVGKGGGGGPPGGGDPYSGAAAAQNLNPGDMRYVDKNFVFKTAADLKAAIESESFSEAPLAVAKRVPFRMRLIMDQRDLSKFLVNCGNNELMVEVSQVRYNPQTATSAGSGSGSPGPGGGMPSAPGMPGAPGAGGMGGKGGPGSGNAGVGGEDGGGAGGMGAGGGGSAVQIAGPVGLSPFDISVDIFGYVQIYNVPGKKKFKHLEQADGAAGGDKAAANATTTPAASTPAASTTPPVAAPTEPAPPADAAGAPLGNPTPPVNGAEPAGGAVPAPSTPAPTTPTPPGGGASDTPPATKS